MEAVITLSALSASAVTAPVAILAATTESGSETTPGTFYDSMIPESKIDSVAILAFIRRECETNSDRQLSLRSLWFRPQSALQKKITEMSRATEKSLAVPELIFALEMALSTMEAVTMASAPTASAVTAPVAILAATTESFARIVSVTDPAARSAVAIRDIQLKKPPLSLPDLQQGRFLS